MNIPRKEILRYLGYKKNDEPDERVLSLIEECVSELETCAQAKYIVREFPLKIEDSTVCIGETTVISKTLARHLADCNNVYLFAATLGIQVDILIARYGKTRISRSAVMQGVGAAMIEEYCDFCCEQLEKEKKRQDLYLKPRFSPGYGDFSLTFQKELLRLTESEKKLGLTATQAGALLPAKSVTAVIGITSKPCLRTASGCVNCNKTDCEFRVN